jgi:hypothetical protein
MYIHLVEETPPAPEPAWVEILYRSRDGENRVELSEERASGASALGWTSTRRHPRGGSSIAASGCSVAGALRVRAEAADRAGLAEQLGGAERSAAGQLE